LIIIVTPLWLRRQQKLKVAKLKELEVVEVVVAEVRWQQLGQVNQE
jgi:hypothetical protein